MAKYRIGIDVGGTFTDAVVIDSETLEIVDKRKIKTSHESKFGVAEGIINVLKTLLKDNKIDSKDIQFIAHGTTQSTNALLEGDVAKVGVIGSANKSEMFIVKKQLVQKNIPLGNENFIEIVGEVIDHKNINEASINKAIDNLEAKGVNVFVASDTFANDDPVVEKMIMGILIQRGKIVTSGHYVSSLYGINMRTKTAIVNGSLLPRMIQTADMTSNVVKELNIDKELMIMRSDGGVMNVSEVRKRPILTLLSGLAAGVAGALMYTHLSDGIFFEVGGTSIDISAIKNGKVQLKNAKVGNQRISVESLDVRTLGIAGGSMVELSNGKLVDVGPRSAHIAGYEYEAFEQLDSSKEFVVKEVDTDGTGKHKYAVVSDGTKDVAITLAGSANFLGYVPKEDFAFAKASSLEKAWEAFGKHIGLSAKDAARKVMDVALDKVEKIVNALIKEYKLNKNIIKFVGGGGSAAITTYALGERMGIKAEVAKDAPFISTIGVALALVKEVIKKTIINPSEKDIDDIRREAIENVIALGAARETVVVEIDVDTRRNIVTASASGATDTTAKKETKVKLTEQQITEMIMQDHKEAKNIKMVDSDETVKVFQFQVPKKFSFAKNKITKVISNYGVIVWQEQNFDADKVYTSEASTFLDKILDEKTTFSNGFESLPQIVVLFNNYIIDLSTLGSRQFMKRILELELQKNSNLANVWFFTKEQ